ncbi:MAG: hypothetical protein AB7F59_08135 [Bdellovibrionales bacterium]
MVQAFRTFLVLILTFTFAFSPASVRAEDVLFYSPQASESDYVVYLQTKPQYMSYVEYWAKRNPSQSDINHLLDVFERAQVAYLHNPFDEAKTLFENVVQLAHQSDWKNSQRELLFTALLRLAQFEQNPEGRNHYLKRAIALDHEMEPNTSLFPPPLIKELKELRKDLRSRAYLFKKPVAERTSSVLLNGKKLNFQKPVMVVEGLHRLTVVSNGHVTWTKVLSQRDFENLYVERKALASGSCEKPQIHSETDLGLTHSSYFFGTSCVREGSKKKIIAMTALLPDHHSSATMPSDAPSKPLWKKPWFWAAVAGVALTAILISQNNQNQPASGGGTQPTHSQGL